MLHWLTPHSRTTSPLVWTAERAVQGRPIGTGTYCDHPGLRAAAVLFACDAVPGWLREQGRVFGDPMTHARLMNLTGGNVTFVNGGLYVIDYESPFYTPPVSEMHPAGPFQVYRARASGALLFKATTTCEVSGQGSVFCSTIPHGHCRVSTDQCHMQWECMRAPGPHCSIAVPLLTCPLAAPRPLQGVFRGRQCFPLVQRERLGAPHDLCVHLGCGHLHRRALRRRERDLWVRIPAAVPGRHGAWGAHASRRSVWLLPTCWVHQTHSATGTDEHDPPVTLKLNKAPLASAFCAGLSIRGMRVPSYLWVSLQRTGRPSPPPNPAAQAVGR